MRRGFAIPSKKAELTVRDCKSFPIEKNYYTTTPIVLMRRK